MPLNVSENQGAGGTKVRRQLVGLSEELGNINSEIFIQMLCLGSDLLEGNKNVPKQGRSWSLSSDSIRYGILKALPHPSGKSSFTFFLPSPNQNKQVAVTEAKCCQIALLALQVFSSWSLPLEARECGAHKFHQKILRSKWASLLSCMFWHWDPVGMPLSAPILTLWIAFPWKVCLFSHVVLGWQGSPCRDPKGGVQGPWKCHLLPCTTAES